MRLLIKKHAKCSRPHELCRDRTLCCNVNKCVIIIITDISLTSSRAFQSMRSGYSSNGSRLCLIVPEKSTGSCGMMDIWLRSSWSPRVPVSRPSIMISPSIVASLWMCNMCGYKFVYDACALYMFVICATMKMQWDLISLIYYGLNTTILLKS